MIRFSHKYNSWQLYIGVGCWMMIDNQWARNCIARGYDIEEDAQ